MNTAQNKRAIISDSDKSNLNLNQAIKTIKEKVW